MRKEHLFLTTFLFIILPFAARAQKLPEFQNTGLRASTGINIDGKATEWNNQFQAYNHSVEIFYTISNDTDKLYLVVQTEDSNIANKIISAGLTFTINGSGKWKDEGGMAITFPFLYRDDFLVNNPPLNYNSSFTAMNKQLTDKTKDIKISGIKGVKDTISVYNTEGVRAASLFDKNKIFTCELAIPLKYLNLSADITKPFSYNIKLNGTHQFPFEDVFPPFNSLIANQLLSIQHTKPSIRHGVIPGPRGETVMGMTGPNAELLKSLISPTSLWGQYTLAK